MFISFLKKEVGFNEEVKFSGGLINACIKFKKPGHILIPVRGINLSQNMTLESSWDEQSKNDSGIVGLLVLPKQMFSIKRIRKQHSQKRKDIILTIASNYIKTSIK